MSLKKLFTELKRRNVIKSALGYLVAAWVIIQVMAIILPTIEAPTYTLKVVLFTLVFGFPVWLIFSWKYEITNEGIKKTAAAEEPTSSRAINRLAKAIIMSISMAVLLFLYWQISRIQNIESNIEEKTTKINLTASAEKSIAVLPFFNISSDKEQDYFCDGISEDIINDLTQLSGVRVAARTSSFAFKGKNLDIRDIGLKLNAQTIVEGSVMKSGKNLRITVNLINVADGFNLWSGQYDRELKDIFSIQKEISENIVQALEINLGNEEELAVGKTKNAQAYDFYLRGRDYFHKAHQDKLLLSIPMFKKAIEKDNNYALAYSGLADSYSWLYMFFDSNPENLTQSIAASKHALELDPNLAEAHSSRGIALAQNKQYDDAENEFDLAIKLSPKLFDAYYEYGRISIMQGKYEQAAKLFEKATQIRPEDYEANIFLVGTYFDLNMETEMQEANQQTLKILRDHIDLYPDDSRALYLGAGTLIKANKFEEAAEWIELAVSLKPNEIAVLYNAACIYSKLGKHNKALDYFERTIDAGYASIEWINNDSDLDAIRNYPRFQEILMKIN